MVKKLTYGVCSWQRAAVTGLLSVFCMDLLTATTLPAATFTASLDRDTVTLGETATLSLAFEGGTPQDVPAPGNIPNLQIAYVGPSSRFSVINGQVSSSVTYNFTVAPQKSGDYTIPALTAKVGSETLTSQPLILKVLAPTAPSQQAIASGSQPAFLKLVLPKQQVFVGESFVIQVQLYVANQIQRISQFQFTGISADGFNTGKMVESQHRQTQIGNTVYSIVPVNIALTAIKAGTLTVGPITANVVLGGRDPFDPFGFFGGRNDQRQVSLATEVEKLQTLSLPRENVPPNFNGAVGVYTMSMTAGPTNVAVGDPITVRVQISGRGAPDALSLPDQPAWHDFKTYPPTTKVELTDQLGLQGSKTFEQIVQPETADTKALPSFSFSFFDPDQKMYRTLTQPPIALVVRPGGTAPAPTVLTSASHEQQGATATPDIVPNKQRLGALAQMGPPLVLQSWFLCLPTVPLAAFVGAFVWRRRTDNLANNPRLRRQRHVAQLIREGLANLERLAAANASDDFFAQAFRLVQEQLGERLDMPASAITEAVIDERLNKPGAPESTIRSLQDFFQTCNLARYAPIKSSQELEAVISKVRELLNQLQHLEQ